jgi:hypothetical protein
MEAFEDAVRVAVVMGGESTHQRTVIKASSRIHLQLNLRSSHVELPGRFYEEPRHVLARNLGVFQARGLGSPAK